MTVLCLGALLAGLAAAPLIPFLPFACALLAAIVIGAGWAIGGGIAVGQAAVSALVLLFACQVGYGLGLASVAFLGRSVAGRRPGDEKGPASPRPLRTGNGPH